MPGPTRLEPNQVCLTHCPFPTPSVFLAALEPSPAHVPKLDPSANPGPRKSPLMQVHVSSTHAAPPGPEGSSPGMLPCWAPPMPYWIPTKPH
ncbi:hypothetical protein JTE90_002353 [Oedothorax gibbosus]|uniref:Uncharacterized protein n=1 Tax=Oedothorax gibbosus TaxID=931172 RepID=A0AAV6UJD5_9ARAC|nr:hypothetical protein JTE90_002353 [Oedothorax gibbosus]